MGSASVEVLNVEQTRLLLARFEPDLLKRLNTRIDVVARNLRKRGQANFEQTGASGTAYRIKTSKTIKGFSKSVIAKGGVSVGEGERWSSAPGVLAAIYELANNVRDAQPQNVARTRSLITTLNARYDQPGRFLWDAWDDIKEESMASVHEAIKQAEAEYTARMK